MVSIESGINHPFVVVLTMSTAVYWSSPGEGETTDHSGTLQAMQDSRGIALRNPVNSGGLWEALEYQQRGIPNSFGKL